MTCLCGDYDYVDSTARTLSDAMTCLSHAPVGREITSMSFDLDHRNQANRIIHEWLTGSPVCRRWLPTYSINEYAEIDLSTQRQFLLLGLNEQRRCVSISTLHGVHRCCVSFSIAILSIGVSSLDLAMKRWWTISTVWGASRTRIRNRSSRAERCDRWPTTRSLSWTCATSISRLHVLLSRSTTATFLLQTSTLHRSWPDALCSIGSVQSIHYRCS